jgi:hypothetical protein
MSGDAERESGCPVCGAVGGAVVCGACNVVADLEAAADLRLDTDEWRQRADGFTPTNDFLRLLDEVDRRDRALRDLIEASRTVLVTIPKRGKYKAVITALDLSEQRAARFLSEEPA